jgi:hypothetical protein
LKARVGLLKAGNAMLILSETIPPPRRQIFNDHTEEDAALKRLDEDDRWVSRFIEALEGVLRRRKVK